MIDVKTALIIHSKLIETFGGSHGIRDLAALEAALARPFATFDQKDLYAYTIDKATALFESLIINHPFIDGNKRTAYVLMRLYLMRNKMDILATQEEKYQLVVAASSGQFRFEEIKTWLVKQTFSN